VSVSDTGTLVFRAGGSEVSDLTWFDRAGTRLGTVWAPKSFNNVALSPDGTTVLTALASKGVERDAWLYDLASATASQISDTGDLAGTAISRAMGNARPSPCS